MRLQHISRMTKKCVDLFKELAKQPTPVSASCHRVHRTRDQLEVVGRWDQRDLTRMENTNFQRSYIISTADSTPSLTAVTTPVEFNKQLRAYSFCGKWLAILRSEKNSQGTDKQYLEIWNDNSRIKTVDLLAQEKHLNVMVDGRFGCLEWSHCGTKVLYSAERFYKTESYFKPESPVKEDPEKNQTKKAAIQKGEEFLFRENWGEALFQAHSPSIYTLHVESEEVCEVSGIVANISCGQATWTADSMGIVFVGYEQEPFRLGLIHCTNRRSALYYADFESGKCHVIGNLEHNVENPRFSLDGKSLVYFKSRSSGAHFNTQSLMKCDWASKAITTVVEEVQSAASPTQFPGLYSMAVPARIWVSDNSTVILQSIWRSRQELISVNVVSGEVTRLTNDPEFGTWSLLDVFEDYIVAVRSSPNRNPSLVLGKLPLKGNSDQPISWITLDDTKRTVSGLDWKTIILNPPSEHLNSKYPNLDYEALLVQLDASEPKLKPLIVFPHGGPHSNITAVYNLSLEYFCKLGFAVLIVNFRGSLGFGQDNIESLLGNIGTQDVEDVAFGVETVLKSEKLDGERMVLYGGSHGGFIVLSLAALYPNLYKACVARNPVVDIASMGATDIPDWAFFETGLQYSMTSLNNPTSTKAMWKRSPMRLVDEIKIPVLFTLGRIDLRVPHYQGLMMHKALKARNVESRVLMYEDNHSLQKITSESDGLVNCAQWMLKYTEVVSRD